MAPFAPDNRYGRSIAMLREQEVALEAGHQYIVVETIKREHATLRAVMELLRGLLRDISAQHGEPDFGLLSAALYYIDEFPERCHHPKEDKYLFKALRQRTAAFNTMLDTLQSEHVSSAQMMREMHRALVLYQGGAPQGLSTFKSHVDVYARLHSDHMRKEEALLAKAPEYLTDSDWHTIAGAFIMDDDPLLSGAVRADFRKLHLRIMDLLPRELRGHEHHLK